MMKFSTPAASAVLLVSSASLMATNAFVGPSSATSSLAQHRQPQPQHRQSQSRLSLLPVVEPNAALESASVLTSMIDGSGVVDTLGSLALLGSVGFGVFMGKSNNKDWSYEYKPGNDAFSSDSGDSSDLALLGESPTSVMEKVEEETPKPSVTLAQETFFGGSGGAVAAPSPPSKATAATTTASPAQKTFFGKGKTAGPSNELLESTEKAKAQVQKVGVKETMDKMSSKTGDGGGSTSPGPEPTPAKVSSSSSSSSEVEESKKPGGKRRVAKGLALIVAAGGVAAARNLVKAYLGRGML